jgi:Mg-chelatase subunit ChlD
MAAYREILLRVADGLAGQLVLNDVMGPEVDYVPGSANPPADEGVRDLRWTSHVFPTSGLTLTYEIRPRSIGLHAANERAVANYLDADGYRRSFEFPVPEVLVEVPPTPRPPEPAYLPMALKTEACFERSHVSVALVVDTSSSMLETGASGVSKLDTARGAMGVFLDRLELDNGDYASIVAFNEDAWVVQATTSNGSALSAALARLEVRRYTRLDRGIETAHEELVRGSPAGMRRVMVVLTDGRANPEPADVAVDRSYGAKADGIEIYTIGLGDDLDLWALEAIATDAAHFLRAPDADDLARVYDEVATMVPCQGRRR